MANIQWWTYKQACTHTHNIFGLHTQKFSGKFLAYIQNSQLNFCQIWKNSAVNFIYIHKHICIYKQWILFDFIYVYIHIYTVCVCVFAKIGLFHSIVIIYIYIFMCMCVCFIWYDCTDEKKKKQKICNPTLK